MWKLAPGLALMLAGCWQVAVVGDQLTSGGSSTGARSTSSGTGTAGRSSSGSSTGRSTSGTSTGASVQCGKCAPGATCIAGNCNCEDGTVCDYYMPRPPLQNPEYFCALGTCAACATHGGSLTQKGNGDQCQITLAFAEYNPSCIAVDATSVYWTDETGVEKTPIIDVRKPLDAGVPPQTLAALSNVVCLAIDAYNVYFTVSDGTVREVPIGGGATTTIAYGQGGPQGIAVDRANVYWTNDNSNQVMRLEKTAAPVTADTIADLADAGGGAPFGIAVDSANVYWTNRFGATVMMVSLDGGAPTTIASGLGEPYAITVDAGNLYWTDRGAGDVRWQPLDGPFDGGIVLASNQGGPTGIATDSNYVYWTNNSSNSISFCPLGGGPVGSIPVRATEAWRIAVDATNLYWTSYDQGLGFVYQLTPK
jgi:sugar lactone lactonase YvrE